MALELQRTGEQETEGAAAHSNVDLQVAYAGPRRLCHGPYKWNGSARRPRSFIQLLKHAVLRFEGLKHGSTAGAAGLEQ